MSNYYKYIKGQEVVLEEHMLSATELARMYGLYNLKNNNPHGMLVKNILNDYVESNNLKVSEYYYVHSKGAMRVYPKIVYEKALQDFVFDLITGRKYTYVPRYTERKFRINYRYVRPRTGFDEF